ncbi:MAG: DNA/RNA non-specific endonuclease [Bdellovibrionales bacterium]|jgi:endonuclease G|nr:DNA/RNA non-specific endonuclease [Bdellovibrionales bacterium]
MHNRFAHVFPFVFVLALLSGCSTLPEKPPTPHAEVPRAESPRTENTQTSSPTQIPKGFSLEGLELPTAKKTFLDHNPASSLQTVQKTGYTALYSSKHRIATWVAYRLPKAKALLKKVPRKDRFHKDTALMNGVAPNEYAKSGYDRGHLAPAEDMRWSADAMYDSFSMVNMTPQSPSLNRGVWKQIEERVREFALGHDEVFIATGPVLTEKCLRHIGKGVCVPQHHFKVVLAHAGSFKAIGFIVPQDAKGSFESWVQTVAEVERRTGLDFFSKLPDALETQVENKADLKNWLSGTGEVRTPATKPVSN